MEIKTRTRHKPVIGALALGLAAVISYQAVQAQRQPPTKHEGVSVTSLGEISSASMTAQIGLPGYKMQLREIVLAPGGQIARHDHFKRPGLVWTLSGSWIEGRSDGEKVYPASLKKAILEDVLPCATIPGRRCPRSRSVP